MHDRHDRRLAMEIARRRYGIRDYDKREFELDIYGQLYEVLEDGSLRPVEIED